MTHTFLCTSTYKIILCIRYLFPAATIYNCFFIIGAFHDPVAPAKGVEAKSMVFLGSFFFQPKMVCSIISYDGFIPVYVFSFLPWLNTSFIPDLFWRPASASGGLFRRPEIQLFTAISKQYQYIEPLATSSFSAQSDISSIDKLSRVNLMKSLSLPILMLILYFYVLLFM